MIKNILKQLWNKRRTNGWILIELILVTFFMWGVIDPVYVLLSNRAIDPGYDIDNVFRLQIGQYPSTHSKFREDFNTDSARNVHFRQIYSLVRQYPGVEYAVVTNLGQYPLSSGSNSSSLKKDSLIRYPLEMSFYKDGDFFKVFKIKDINTGEYPDHHDVSPNTMYLTENLTDRLFPESNAIGGLVYRDYNNDTTFYRVAGVMQNYKFRSTDQPWETNFIPLDDFDSEEFPSSAQVCFRIKDGLSKQVFAEQFKKEIESHLSVGNLYFLQLTDFKSILTYSEFTQGVTNKLRLQIILTAFFLICTFLGIAGTFWLRSDARKSEIGLRMALGGSRKNILNEFLTESWLLTTLAWFIGILFVLQRVHFTGFAEAGHHDSDVYLQSRFVPHFLIVSLIVYILLIFISFIGTWIPANRASKISASDALRDE